MNYDWTLWLTFVLIGVVATTLPRASFIVLGERASLLIYVCGAVIVALQVDRLMRH
mgnify:CR=1 FL=1